VPFVFAEMVFLANELPIVLENKYAMMYSFVYIVYLKIMLITYINLSDLRTIIQSATLLIHKFKRKVSYGRGTNLACLQNLVTFSLNLMLTEIFKTIFLLDW
jgi:hypothetical protein